MGKGIFPNVLLPGSVDGGKKSRASSLANIHAGGAQMMLSPNRQYRLQGWVVSAVFHGLALTVTLGLMAQVKQAVPKDPFTWDVSLVEPQQRIQETHQAEMTPAQEPAKPTPHPAVPAPSQPKKVTREVLTREVTEVVEEPPTEVQRTKQSVVEATTPVLQHEAVTAEPLITAAPVPQAVIQPVISEAPVHPVEAGAIETASVTRDSDLSAPMAPATATAGDAKPAESVARESALQTAMTTSPTPAVKADYAWLAESLRRRLAEIKRYPSAARLNGWEGKVVLRAVIRADGHLSEVKVHRSSGHEALDNAAMEAIRLVCPLHMANTIAAAEIAVLVPMVYSLGS